MGRNKLPDHLKRKRHTFRLSSNAKKELKDMSSERGKSMSQLIELMIMEKRYHEKVPSKLT